MTQIIAPQTAELWLSSRERLKMLRNRLIIVSASKRPHPTLALKMQRLMHHISAEIETERAVVMMIEQIETRHRRDKSGNRLRRYFGPIFRPALHPFRRKEPRRIGLLSWIFGARPRLRPARYDL
ncbi:MAG: hypothetical protein WBK91_11140 [Alphaproteobacteria bacterium]